MFHMTRCVEPGQEAVALGLVADGDGPTVGPVDFGGVQFWAAIEVDASEVTRRRVNGLHGALHGDVALQAHLDAELPPAVQLRGCLVSTGTPALSLQRASQLAGYAPRSILVDERDDLLAVMVDAALLDQGVVVGYRDGRLEVAATPGPRVPGRGLDRRELLLLETVFSAWIAAKSGVASGSAATARR
jgi:hypothetical protein